MLNTTRLALNKANSNLLALLAKHCVHFSDLPVIQIFVKLRFQVLEHIPLLKRNETSIFSVEVVNEFWVEIKGNFILS